MSSSTATTSNSSPHGHTDIPITDPARSSPAPSLSAKSDETIERGSSLLSEPIDFDLETSSRAEPVTHEMEMEETTNTTHDQPQSSTSSTSHVVRPAPIETVRNPSPVPVAQPNMPQQILERPRPPRLLPQPPAEIPDDFWHPFIHVHPWGHLVLPRTLNWSSLRKRNITNDMPDQDYRHIPDSGYLRYQFTKSLFPFVDTSLVGTSERIPVIALQTLEAAVAFRHHSQSIINEPISGNYLENTLPPTPDGEKPTLLLPPPVRHRRPVLYQVVAVNRGRGVILEPKDFLVTGPDRHELRCLLLDQFATNIQSNKRGFDKILVSIKDLIWIYTVEPSNQALRDPQATWDSACSPRSRTLDDHARFFFRVAEYAFVTPQESRTVMGHVLRILYRNQLPSRFSAAFAGEPDAVIVTPAICSFGMDEVVDDEMLSARSRHNLSTAIRFSEPAASVEVRKTLCQFIRDTVPCHLHEGILPLSVSKLNESQRCGLGTTIALLTTFYPTSGSHSTK